jgi:hypothetical protein
MQCMWFLCSAFEQLWVLLSCTYRHKWKFSGILYFSPPIWKHIWYRKLPTKQCSVIDFLENMCSETLQWGHNQIFVGFLHVLSDLGEILYKTSSARNVVEHMWGSWKSEQLRRNFLCWCVFTCEIPYRFQNLFKTFWGPFKYKDLGPLHVRVDWSWIQNITNWIASTSTYKLSSCFMNYGMKNDRSLAIYATLHSNDWICNLC